MSDKPSFKALFEEYAAAYDKKELSAIEPYLSPNVQGYFKGQLIADGYGDQMKKYFTDHWARPNYKVDIKEIIEIEGEDAVRVKLIDHTQNKSITANYYWAKENGKWLQIKHEVTEFDDWTADS